MPSKLFTDASGKWEESKDGNGITINYNVGGPSFASLEAMWKIPASVLKSVFENGEAGVAIKTDAPVAAKSEPKAKKAKKAKS